MKISLVQYNPKWEDKSYNQSQILLQLERKTELGSFAVFPEMTLTGFSMNVKAMSESLNGDSVNYFSATAKKYKVNIFAGIIEKRDNRYYNTLVHMDTQGNLKNTYRKIHPFSYSTEDQFYTAGNNLVVAEIKGWRIGLTICYDLRFPELYRLYAKKGVDLILNIANWPNSRIEHWRTLLKARAIENQCYIVGVNRVGNDVKLHYDGYSAVFDPMGKEIVAVKDKEVVIIAELDKKYLRKIQAKLPFLNDMKLI